MRGFRRQGAEVQWKRRAVIISLHHHITRTKGESFPLSEWWPKACKSDYSRKYVPHFLPLIKLDKWRNTMVLSRAASVLRNMLLSPRALGCWFFAVDCHSLTGAGPCLWARRSNMNSCPHQSRWSLETVDKQTHHYCINWLNRSFK